MPVSNFARTAANNTLRRTMNGQMLNAVGQVGGPLDQLQARMNRATSKYLRTSKMGKYVQGVSINEQGWGVRAKIGKYSFSLGKSWSGLYSQDPQFPEEVLVTVVVNKMANQSSNDNGAALFAISAPMQEPIQLRLQNAWEPVAPMGGMMPAGLQAALQSATNVQMTSRLMTRRIWRGAHPMQITIKMVFEAKDDAIAEVIVPCTHLMKIAAPAEVKNIGVLSQCFLIPPGPSPFTRADLKEAHGLGSAIGKAAGKLTGGLTDELGTSFVNGWNGIKASMQGTAIGRTVKAAEAAVAKAGTDDVDIKIGKFCTFKRVVIEDISVEFDMTRVTPSGHPLGAVAAVQFSAYEIATKDTLDSMFSTKSRVG